MRFIFGLILIVFWSCPGCALAAIERGPADDAFYPGDGVVLAVGGKSLTYATSYALYLSSDQGHSWRCLYATPPGAGGPRFRGCVGGSESALLFLDAPASPADDSPDRILMRWTPDGKISAVGSIPPLSTCAFASDLLGAYAHERDVFLTGDGGRTWKRATPLIAGPPDRVAQAHLAAAQETLCTLAWLSAREMVIASHEGVVAVYEAAADGSGKLVWSKQIAGSDRLLACGDGEIWAGDLGANLLRLSASDGTLIERVPRQASSHIAIGNRRAYTGGQKANSFALTDKTMEKTGTIDAPFVSGLIIQDGGGVLVVTSYNKFLEWDGKNAPVSLPPRIDNSVLRDALKPGPDVPTAEDIDAMRSWQAKAGTEAADKINDYMDEYGASHKDMMGRALILYGTEQYKKAALNGGKWDPPGMKPATQTASTKP